MVNSATATRTQQIVVRAPTGHKLELSELGVGPDQIEAVILRADDALIMDLDKQGFSVKDWHGEDAGFNTT